MRNFDDFNFTELFNMVFSPELISPMPETKKQTEPTDKKDWEENTNYRIRTCDENKKILLNLKEIDQKIQECIDDFDDSYKNIVLRGKLLYLQDNVLSLAESIVDGATPITIEINPKPKLRRVDTSRAKIIDLISVLDELFSEEYKEKSIYNQIISNEEEMKYLKDLVYKNVTTEDGMINYTMVHALDSHRYIVRFYVNGNLSIESKKDGRSVKICNC